MAAAIPVPGPIGTEHERLGGDTGILGPPIAPQQCGLAQDGCLQEFTYGTITWTAATGAHAIVGAINAAWKSAGGVNSNLGYPIKDEECGFPDGVCRQQFRGGYIYNVPDVGAFPTFGAINARYESLGGTSGRLGYPKSAEQCGFIAGVCRQLFQRGNLYYVPNIGTFWTTGAINAVYEQFGGIAGYFGYPTGDEECGLPDGVCRQRYRSNSIYFVPGYGTFPAIAAINSRYEQLGGVTGYFGPPIAAEQCGLHNGSCMQKFRHGNIYYVPGHGTFPTIGAINAKYQSLGGIQGSLGSPISGEDCRLRDGACLQRFTGGNVYYVPGYGTFKVNGAINARWEQFGGIFGYLGAPRSDEQCGLRFAGCVQTFRSGKMYYAPGISTQPVWGGLGSYYNSRMAQNGAIGYPISPEICDGAGNCIQRFQWGHLQWLNGQGVRWILGSDGYCPALNSGAVKYGSAGAQRVTFAIADEYRSTQVKFVTCVKRADGQYVNEWGAIGSAGESGFARPGVATGPTWQAYSPTGSYTVTEGFGLGNPGTALAYRTLNPFSRWGGQLNANYNKYFESSADIFPDENMWYFATRPTHDYRQGVVINYNRPPDSPIIMNAGFAIFVHGNNKPTWGCIALNDPDLLQFMRTARPGDRIVMGVGYDIFN